MKKAIGIDVGGTKIRGGIVREDGQLLKVQEVPTEAHLGGKEMVERIIRLIHQLGTVEVAGVGVGTSGQVSLQGELLSATELFPEWAGIALQRVVQERLQLPVRVVNDVQAMALGELAFGAGHRYKDFLCLALGTGVGGAIVYKGRLMRGANGAAGEVGHMLLHPGGRRCPCGQVGCFEAYVSGRALEERYLERTGVRQTGSSILQSPWEGDPRASGLLEEYLDDLCNGIASLVAVLNPQAVILGGGVARSLPPYVPQVEKKVLSLLSRAAAQNFSLVLSELGDSSMLLGAGSLLFDQKD